MKPEEVAAYLKQHPEFFEHYADMLAEIYIPHPHGGRAIPISERQILTLRDKSKQLEGKLRELIQFGEENDAIGEKVHRMALALLGAGDLAAVFTTVRFNLREDFAIPHVVLRTWGGNGAAGLPELAPVSDATREFATSLTQPYCSAHAMVDTAGLFGESAPHLRSFSYIPLRDASASLGLITLASEDPKRFYPEMGTMYLKRIGDMVSTALQRHARGTTG
jgi:uncharacterized protein YigA (DUF484 family)